MWISCCLVAECGEFAGSVGKGNGRCAKTWTRSKKLNTTAEQTCRLMLALASKGRRVLFAKLNERNGLRPRTPLKVLLAYFSGFILSNIIPSWLTHSSPDSVVDYE